MSRSIIALALAALCVAPALAQQPLGPDRSVMLLLGASATYDSNVQRLSNAGVAAAEALLGTGPSDRLLTASAGVAFDKPYAQQRFVGTANATAYRYDKFTYLDFDGVDYGVGWLWHLSPRINGALRGSQTQALVNYAYFPDPTQQNVVTTRDYTFTASGHVTGGWYLLGGALQHSTENSAQFTESPSYRTSGGEAGIRYDSSPGNSITANLRSAHGVYVNQPVDPATFTDDGFRRLDAELLATWKLGGKSTLNLRLVETDYRSDNFSQRSFSGLGGKAVFRWTPAAKLSVDFSASRDYVPWTTDYASYRRDDTLGIAPAWQMSERTSLTASLTRMVSDYLQPIPGYTGELRVDTDYQGRVAFEWKPLRNLTLSAGLIREHRRSNDPTGEFDRTAVNATASLRI